jgi:hypothetical protein
MECHKANRIWFGSYLGIKFNPSHKSFIDWLLYFLANLKEEELCYIEAITYGIWFARNKMILKTMTLKIVSSSIWLPLHSRLSESHG